MYAEEHFLLGGNASQGEFMNQSIRASAVALALLAATAGTARADTFYYPGGWVSVTGNTLLATGLNNLCGNNMTACMGALEQYIGPLNKSGSFTINGFTGPTIIAYGPVTTTPEPLTMALLGTGLAGIAVAARRRKREQGELV